GLGDKNLIASGLGAESRRRWREAFAAWRQLEMLVEDNGGRMIFGVLRAAPLFIELAKQYYSESGMRSAFIVADYFGERLPHDAHPNREGHRILALHYLHVMAKLGWLPADHGDLPPLRPELSTETRYPPDKGTVATLQEDTARQILREEIM